MGMNFNLKDFMNGDFGVNCETKEEAKVFMQFLSENGLVWADGEALLDFIGWDEYEEETIYSCTTHCYEEDMDLIVRSSIDQEEDFGADPYYKFSDFKFEKKKARGFEFISSEQVLKDCSDMGTLIIKNPKRGTSKSAGYDIFAPIDIVLKPGEEIKVPTGLKAYMQDGEVLLAFPRSGLGFKYYCRLSNTVGIIDCDYFNNKNNEGHMWVKIRNEGDKTMEIKQEEAFCQMIFMPFLLADGDSFDSGEERIGGFGSTTK